MRGEMQKMGHGLQAGIMAISCSETRTERKKIAAPRDGSSELEGSAPAGEDRVIRETWRVTEKVTETVTQTLKGEETTCTRETRREVTELTETREMGTIEKRLHGTEGVEEDAHTHTHTHTEVVEDNGGELAQRVETRCGQRVPTRSASSSPLSSTTSVCVCVCVRH